jgi:hypothetical protein
MTRRIWVPRPTRMPATAALVGGIRSTRRNGNGSAVAPMASRPPARVVFPGGSNRAPRIPLTVAEVVPLRSGRRVPRRHRNRIAVAEPAASSVGHAPVCHRYRHRPHRSATPQPGPTRTTRSRAVRYRRERRPCRQVPRSRHHGPKRHRPARRGIRMPVGGGRTNGLATARRSVPWAGPAPYRQVPWAAECQGQVLSRQARHHGRRRRGRASGCHRSVATAGTGTSARIWLATSRNRQTGAAIAGTSTASPGVRSTPGVLRTKRPVATGVARHRRRSSRPVHIRGAPR